MQHDDVPWRPWSPRQVAERFRGLTASCGPVRWAVAGGWAIDLFLGRTTREHQDLEIVVLRDDVPAVLEAFGVAGRRWAVPTPAAMLRLDDPAAAGVHQTWLLSEPDGGWVLDVFRDLHDGDTWICRRDPAIRRPWPDVVAHRDSVPYLVPEIVLLFKAKAARPKDVADLRAALPALDDVRRADLAALIDRVHPRHAWLGEVRPAPRPERE